MKLKELLEAASASEIDFILKQEAFHLSTLNNERFSIVFLKNGKVISKGREDMSSGSYKSTKVPLRNVVERTRKLEADQILVLHNHPADNETTSVMASRNDILAGYHTVKALENDGLSVDVHFYIVPGRNIGRTGTDVVQVEPIEYFPMNRVIVPDPAERDAATLRKLKRMKAQNKRRMRR